MSSYFRRLGAGSAAVCLATLMLLCNVSSIFAQAQSNAADLRGIITDPNGAVVAGATVTARQPSINVTRSTTSNEAGEYTISNLPPEEYEVTVEAANFKRSVFPNVRLTVGQRADLNAQLEIGAQNLTVTVSDATTEIVETTRTAVATTIDQQRIENLPINQRDYLGFALTTSQVGRDNGRPIGPAPTSGLNFGGQRGRSNLVQVDGADNTDNSINAARTTVSQEAVQEFQVVTNSFAPEFGRSAGGIVNVVTKRGTNQFTGNVFGFIRDKRIQARNPFAPVEKPDFRRTQYGATLGGPIIRDKTFFFGAVEQRRRDESGFFTSDVVQGLTESTTIPVISVPGLNLNPTARTFNRLTTAQAAFINQSVQGGVSLLGNPATLSQGIALICGARAYAFFASSGGNTGLTGTNPLLSSNDGSACNSAPIGQPITPILPGQQVGSRFFLSGAPIPVGTQSESGEFIAFRPLLNLQRIFPVTDRTTYSSIRVDHNFSDAHQLNVRFGYNPSRTTGIQVESQNQSLGQNDFSRTGIQRLKDYSFITGLTSTFGNIVNEARFNFGRREASFRSQNGEAVSFNISGAAFIGRELFSPVDRTENRYQIADNVTFVTGDHTFKFGADFNWVNIPSAVFELNFAGLFNFGPTPASNFGLPASAPAFTPVQSYGLGFPSTYIQGFGNPVSSYKNQPIAFFAQDSWKATRRLTLNYGLRYDIELTEQKEPTGFSDPLSGINLSAEDIRAAQDALNVQQGIPRDKDNIAPRFGFAYDVFGNSRTVVRGAVGLFYDHPLLAIAFNSDIADAAQQQQAVLTAGSPSPTALLNAAQVFQGTVCNRGAATSPVCAAPGVLPAGGFTPGVAPSAQYQFGRQRFDDQTFTGFGTVLPFSLPISKDFEYASATQANLTLEQELTRNMSVSISYLYVGARNLPHPLDVNAPRTDLQIQNFQRFAGRLPANQQEAVAFTIPVAPPGSPAGGAGCSVVIPGAIAQCAGGRVVAPAFANFFRPNAPNYFLTQSTLNLYNANPQIPPPLRRTLADFNNELAGSLRTPGVISPFGSVNAQVSDGESEYNALTIDLRRRFANNFQFLASYTFSKAIDDSSDLQTLLLPQENRNFEAERALSLFDQRHRFVFSGVLASPGSWRGSDNWFYRVLSDFTVAPIVEISSGRPFNILTNTDTNNDQSSQTDRPNVLPDGTLCVPGQPIGNNQICGSLFETNREGQLVFASGNLGRNRGVTHAYASFDLRLTRAIRFGERVRLDLIAEGFNLFNRFNEAAASPFVEDVNAFGQRSSDGRYYSRPTAAFDPRQFQFGIKLNF